MSSRERRLALSLLDLAIRDLDRVARHLSGENLDLAANPISHGRLGCRRRRRRGVSGYARSAVVFASLSNDWMKRCSLPQRRIQTYQRIMSGTGRRTMRSHSASHWRSSLMLVASHCLVSFISELVQMGKAGERRTAWIGVGAGRSSVSVMLTSVTLSEAVSFTDVAFCM